MAIDTTPAKFHDQIRAAEKFRAKHVDNATTLAKRFVGNYYRTDWRGSKPRPENILFSYVANLLPKLVYDNPRVMVKASRTISHEPIASAMQHALDAWIVRVDLRDELELMAVDFAFGYGVAKIGLEERGDFAADSKRGVYGHFNMLALQPYVVRVPPNAFLVDPAANSIAEARWMGHQFTRDLDELKADSRYDQAVVAELTGDGDTTLYGDKPLPGKPKTNGDRPDTVTLYEVYLVESRQVGTLVGVGSGTLAWVRPLAEYVGHEDGPFVIFGAYTVPNTVYPLSPLAAMAEQEQDLNAHATAAAQEAASHKKIILVDSNQPGLEAAVFNAPTGGVVGIPGLAANSVANVELGGTSMARYTHLDQLRDRLDRVIGFSDAQRGKAQGTTATEANIAATAGDSRIDFIALKYQIGVREIMSRVAWFLFYDPAVVLPVSWQDGGGVQQEGLFLGGVQEGQDDMAWTDFALNIDPYSLQRTDPAKARAEAMESINLAATVAPLMMQFPYINWRALLDAFGQASNQPDFASRILNQQGLQMLGMGVLPGMAAGGGPEAQATAQVPGNAAPGMQAATAGQPTLASPQSPPAAFGGGFRGPGLQKAASLNPGVAAMQSLGYGGRGAMAAAPAA